MTVAGDRREGLVEVVEPLGPGLEFDQDPVTRERIARRARRAGPWLGLDRAVLVDSDDGTGRGVRALVGVPSSTFAGCRIGVAWTGALVDDRGPILIGRVEGVADPPPAVARVVSERPTSAWLGPEEAYHLAREGRRRYRVRRTADRVVGGQAWDRPIVGPEYARFATPHAWTGYSLRRLPPRYARALERLLDPNERVLYAIERPAVPGARLFERSHRRRDRRAASLVLTDRQACWLVDHADPDRYLSDWGVDVESIAIETVVGIDIRRRSGAVEIHIRTPIGATRATLPTEYAAEAEVFAALVRRFVAASGTTAVRRRYPVAECEPDWSRVEAFHQVDEARSLAARHEGPSLGLLFSPRRPGRREAALWVLAEDGLRSISSGGIVLQRLDAVHAIRLVLSPREGRVEVVGVPGVALDFPAPFADDAAALVRSIRRRIADAQP